MPKPKQSAQCRLCRHWQPKYSGVGICAAEGSQDAKFWISDQEAKLFTKADFACLAFVAQSDNDLRDEVL